MGNQNSSNNRMAISAMSHMMKLTRGKLLMLRDHCVNVSEKGDTASGYQISRAKFMASMGVVKVSNEPDYEVLEKLLILWDTNGSDRIDPLLFLAGVSSLATVMDIPTKLRLAFEVFDYKEKGTLSRDSIESIIGAINKVASFFGDAVLHESQIGVIIDDLFEECRSFDEEVDEINYTDNIFKMSIHPLTIKFVSCQGTVRHGTVHS